MLDDLEILKSACCVAGLDGSISDEELVLLKKLAARVGVGQASLDAMIERATEEPDFYEQQLKFLSGDADGAVKVLFRVAVADGQLGTAERVIIQHLATKVGVDDERYEQILRAAEREAGS